MDLGRFLRFFLFLTAVLIFERCLKEVLLILWNFSEFKSVFDYCRPFRGKNSPKMVQIRQNCGSILQKNHLFCKILWPAYISWFLELESQKVCKKHLNALNFLKIKFSCAWNAFLHPILRLKGAAEGHFSSNFGQNFENFRIFA